MHIKLNRENQNISIIIIANGSNLGLIMLTSLANEVVNF